MSRYRFIKIEDDITSISRLKEMFTKINEEDFNKIIKSDPTYKENNSQAGKYARWILSMYNQGRLKLEDLYKVTEYLKKFELNKAKFVNKDINAYKTLPDLVKAIEETENKELSKSGLKRVVQKTDLDKDAQLFMETENFKIYIPLTYEANCKLGTNTEWCTATRSNRNYYDYYTEDGHKLYVMINKNDPLIKYQWNDKEKYTCDRYDKEIYDLNLCVLYNDLSSFFEKVGYKGIKEAVQDISDYKNGKEYIYDGEKIPAYLGQYITKLKVISDHIDFKAFKEFASLEYVELSENVCEISDYAFERCRNLKEINLSNNLKEIGSYAFFECNSLKKIIIPDSVKKIHHDAFSRCESLTSVKLPSNLDNIEFGIFERCKSLISINFPNNIKEIYSNAFEGCSSLKSIEVPSSVDVIGYEAFADCASLETVKIAEGVSFIERRVFADCPSLKYVEMPNSIAELGNYIFAHSENVTVITSNPYVIDYCEENNIKYKEI